MSDLRRYVGQRMHFLRGPVLLTQGGRGGMNSLGWGPMYSPGDELTLTAEHVLATLDDDGTSWLDSPSDFWAWGPAPAQLKPSKREHARRVLSRAISAQRGSERLEATNALAVLVSEAER